MLKGIYSDYAALVRQKSEIESQLEELKPRILADMAKEKLEKFQHESGTFSISKRTSYEYDEEIKGAEDMLKQSKEVAVEQGRAVPTVTESIRFQAVK